MLEKNKQTYQSNFKLRCDLFLIGNMKTCNYSALTYGNINNIFMFYNKKSANPPIRGQ